MIEKILNQSVELKGYQVSFVLGQKILTKSGFDWVEVQGAELSISEWEDLKDLCLQGNQKIQLETQGIVAGAFQKNNQSWRYVFIENKNCYRAHLTLQKKFDQNKLNIQNPYFWETLKKNHGFFVVLGAAGQGKTSFLNEVSRSMQNNKLSMIGVHCEDSNLMWSDDQFIIRLGATVSPTQELYEGLDRIIIDSNEIDDWNKWISFAEAGLSIHLSLKINSLDNFLNRIFCDLSGSLLRRFLFQLNGVIAQKIVGDHSIHLSEFILFKNDEMKNFLNANDSIHITNFKNANWFKNSETFQSLNQSIIQNLVRRQIDVPTAFAASDNPTELDHTLKKMGL